MADAYMVTDLIGSNAGEVDIFSPDEFFDEYDIPMIAGTVEIVELELVDSIDHGQNTAEELLLHGIATAGDLIMARVLISCGLPVSDIDCFGLAAAEFHVERSGGSWWIDPELYPDGFQQLSDSYLYHFEYMLSDCGFIVETSGDAGMTWVYAPIEESS